MNKISSIQSNSAEPRPAVRGHSLAAVWLALGVSLCLALPAFAQQRGGFGGATGGRSGTSGSAGTSARTYPNNGTIGDAYFSIDPETRRVVYIADEATARYIAQVLTNLDRPKPQVLIKVVFVEVQHNNSLDLGVEGGWGKQINSDTTANAVNGFGLSGLSSVMGTNVNRFGQPISSFSSGTAPTTGAGLYQILGQDYQVTLRAIAQAGNAKILSRPSILARNNQPATITVGQSVPLVTSVSYNGLNGTPINAISYRDVGVILKVTPFITADGLVEMIVSPQISSIDASLSIPISSGVNAPVIDVRSADTVAVTGDGETVIIGGLMETDKTTTDTKIPLLGDIPLLGNLFKHHQKNNTQTELLIFLTPHIVQNPTELAALSAREKARSDAPKEFKEKELEKFFDSLPTKAPPAGTNAPGAFTQPNSRK